MNRGFLVLLLASMVAGSPALADGPVVNRPSGPATGDLGGSYPGPTVTNLSHVGNGSLAPSGLAPVSPNTVLGSPTAASPTALPVPSCSSSTTALQWLSGTGFQCSPSFLAAANNLSDLSNDTTALQNLINGQTPVSTAGGSSLMALLNGGTTGASITIANLFTGRNLSGTSTYSGTLGFNNTTLGVGGPSSCTIAPCDTWSFPGAKLRIAGENTDSIVGIAYQYGTPGDASFPTGATGQCFLGTGTAGNPNTCYGLFGRTDMQILLAAPGSAGIQYAQELDSWVFNEALASRAATVTIPTTATASTVSPVTLPTTGVTTQGHSGIVFGSPPAGVNPNMLISLTGIPDPSFVNSVGSGGNVISSNAANTPAGVASGASATFYSDNALTFATLSTSPTIQPGWFVTCSPYISNVQVIQTTTTVAYLASRTGNIPSTTSCTFTLSPTYSISPNTTLVGSDMFSAAQAIAAWGNYPSAMGQIFRGPQPFDIGSFYAASGVTGVDIWLRAVPDPQSCGGYGTAGNSNCAVNGAMVGEINENRGDDLARKNEVYQTTGAFNANNPVVQIMDSTGDPRSNSTTGVHATITQDGTFTGIVPISDLGAIPAYTALMNASNGTASPVASDHPIFHHNPLYGWGDSACAAFIAPEGFDTVNCPDMGGFGTDPTAQATYPTRDVAALVIGQYNNPIGTIASASGYTTTTVTLSAPVSCSLIVVRSGSGASSRAGTLISTNDAPMFSGEVDQAPTCSGGNTSSLHVSGWYQVSGAKLNVPTFVAGGTGYTNGTTLLSPVGGDRVFPAIVSATVSGGIVTAISGTPTLGGSYSDTAHVPGGQAAIALIDAGNPQGPGSGATMTATWTQVAGNQAAGQTPSGTQIMINPHTDLFPANIVCSLQNLFIASASNCHGGEVDVNNATGYDENSTVGLPWSRGWDVASVGSNTAGAGVIIRGKFLYGLQIGQGNLGSPCGVACIDLFPSSGDATIKSEVANLDLNTAGGTQFQVTNTANACDHWNVTGEPSGSNVAFLYLVGCDSTISGVLKSKGLGVFSFQDGTSATTNFQVAPIASAANFVGVSGATAGNAPILFATGSDSVVGLLLKSKSTGTVAVRPGTDTAIAFAVQNAAGSTVDLSVNSSTGVTTLAGLSSPGVINFSGLTASLPVCTDGSKNLATSGCGLSAVLSGTSGSIGGGALLAGACASGTSTVTGATTSMVALADPNTYPGDGAYWDAQVTSANTITTKVCAAVALTPTSSTYNIRVIQ